MIIRVPKESAAYLYALLESYEGLTNHSTVGQIKESPFRDVFLHYSPQQKEELNRVLECLQREIIGLEILST